MYEIVLTNGQRVRITQAVMDLVSERIEKSNDAPVITKSGKNSVYVIKPAKVESITPLN